MVHAEPTRRVRFEGLSQRSGPLTVGQANMLRCIARDEPAHINMHVVWALPPDADLDRVTRALATLHARHETLRTTYPAGPQPSQRVHGSGELTVHVHPAEGDAGRFAEELGLRLRAIAFDPEGELPVRAAVVTVGGAPARLVLALSHAALDAGALGILRREWLDLMSGVPLTEPAKVGPVDLALLERSAEGQRRLASSLDYWAGLLRTIPQAMFAVPAVPAPDRVEGWTPRLRIRSNAAADALAMLAKRTGVTRSALLLTALCALTAHYAGQRQSVVTSLSANRQLPELAGYMGTAAQDALLAVPVDINGGDGFDALARRVRKRSQLAYTNSWFDPTRLWERIDAVGIERGTRFARDCVFNDLSPLGLDGGVLRGAVDSRDPTRRIQLTRLPAEPIDVELMLWAFRLEGELDLSLWASPVRFAAHEAELFGAGLAALLIEAARGDVKLAEIEAITGLEPVTRGPRWLVSDGCWIDLDEVDELLASVLAALLPAPTRRSGPPRFQVVAEPGPQCGHRLVCRVEARRGAEPLTVHDLQRIHASCVAGLAGRPAAMAPHVYEVVEHLPAARDPQNRKRGRIVISGSGRPAVR